MTTIIGIAGSLRRNRRHLGLCPRKNLSRPDLSADDLEVISVRVFEKYGVIVRRDLRAVLRSLDGRTSA